MEADEVQELVQYIRLRMVENKYGDRFTNFDLTDKVYKLSDKLNYQQNRACRIHMALDVTRLILYCAVLEGDKIIFYKNDDRKFTIEFDGNYDEAKNTWESIFK